MHWNEERVKAFESVEIERGIRAFFATPDGLHFDAMARDEEEAKFLSELRKAAEKEGEAYQRFRRGGMRVEGA